MPSRDDDNREPDPGAEVIPLRASDAGSVTAFDEGRPGGAAYLDVTGTEAKRRDIIPAHLQRGRIGGTLAEWADRASFQARFHGIRLPWYVLWFTWLALRGAGSYAAQLFAWADALHLRILESQAVARGPAGHHEAMNAHKEGERTRGRHWKIVGVCAVLAAVSALALWRYAPRWSLIFPGAIVFCVLVWRGRPENRPIIKPAILPAEFTIPTPEIIIEALCSLGIDKINAYVKEHGTLEKVMDLHKDGDGWGSEWNLPRGVTARMIVQRRPQLSAGLRRPLSAVWPEGVPHEHEGRLDLWIGRHDLAKVKPPPYPLLRAGTADIFGQVPFAAVPRGTAVTVPMFQANYLIGAAPGEGKTSAVRVLGSGAALDAICDLWTHELAGKGDLAAFEQVAYRYCSGLDDEAIEYAARSVTLLRQELEKRSKILKKIPTEARLDGAITRELARADRRLRPIVAIFDEVQNLFLHPVLGADAANSNYGLPYVMRLGRAYGIIVILATQRPDKDCLPTAISGLVQVRFCLKVSDYLANDMILGTGAYKAGFSAVEFRHEVDAGLGWLRGTGDAQAVKTYYLNLKDTAKVCARARAMRQVAGVLSGYALGEDGDQSPRDVLADVLSVFGHAEAGLHWEVLASRLAGRYPERWAGATAESVSAECRADPFGVPSVGVRFPSTRDGRVLAGCRRADVEAAAVAS